MLFCRGNDEVVFLGNVKWSNILFGRRALGLIRPASGERSALEHREVFGLGDQNAPRLASLVRADDTACLHLIDQPSGAAVADGKPSLNERYRGLSGVNDDLNCLGQKGICVCAALFFAFGIGLFLTGFFNGLQNVLVIDSF